MSDFELSTKIPNFEKLRNFIIALIAVLIVSSWLYCRWINHIPLKWQTYYLILGFWPNFIASCAAAIIFFYFIDRRFRERDEILRIQEEEKETVRREREHNNQIHGALIQQFPPMISRMVEVQSSAFFEGLNRFKDIDNVTYTLMAITNHLRHYANVHLDTITTLESLDVNTNRADPFAKFSNYIAILSIFVVRDKDNPKALLNLIDKKIKEIDKLVDQASPSRSHMDRIIFDYKSIPSKAIMFDRLPNISKIEFCSLLAEITGHSANLFINELNKCFKTEVSHLEHSKCHANRAMA